MVAEVLFTVSTDDTCAVVSRIAGRLLVQHTLAATQGLTIYSTTSSHGHYWSNSYVSNAVPWYFYHHTYIMLSNAIPWQLLRHYSELTPYEQIVYWLFYYHVLKQSDKLQLDIYALVRRRQTSGNIGS